MALHSVLVLATIKRTQFEQLLPPSRDRISPTQHARQSEMRVAGYKEWADLGMQMPTATQRDLKWLSELPASRIQDFKAGKSLTDRTGYGIDELVARVAIDRFQMAAALHREARAALERFPPSHRNAISRAYYAMYQTFRGIVFFRTGGDDHEKHSELSQHIPGDFPARPYWENTLKNARLERNRADYEPYPRGEHHFARQSAIIYEASHQLRSVARAYLRGKGLGI